MKERERDKPSAFLKTTIARVNMEFIIKKESDRAEFVRILMSNNYNLEIRSLPTKTGKSKIHKITIQEERNDTTL